MKRHLKGCKGLKNEIKNSKDDSVCEDSVCGNKDSAPKESLFSTIESNDLTLDKDIVFPVKRNYM